VILAGERWLASGDRLRLAMAGCGEGHSSDRRLAMEKCESLASEGVARSSDLFKPWGCSMHLTLRPAAHAPRVRGC